MRPENRDVRITPDRTQTVSAVTCFLIDTIDIADSKTRLEIAGLLERRLQEDYTSTIMTDPSRRLNHADPEQVKSGIAQIISAFREENPDREIVRRNLGLDTGRKT